MNSPASLAPDQKSPGASPPAAQRIAPLDGLRAIAILLVVVMHYYTIPPTPEGAAVHDFFKRATSLGFSGVDLFFVLSGFLIGGILLDHRDSPRLLPAFYARRFFRIVPLYLLLLVTFFIGRETPGINATNYGTYFASLVPTWSYFVFVQNISMATLRDIGPYWLGVSWSLAVEEQFYLLTPFVIRRLRLRHLIWCSIIVIGLSPLLRLNALHNANNGFAAVFLLPTRADGLMWGVLCACLMRHEATRAALRRHGVPLAIFIAAGLIFFGFVSSKNLAADSPQMISWGYSLLSVWFAAMVVGVIVFPEAAVVRLLGWRPLAAIGIASYFIYLFHTPIWYSLHWIFFQQPPLHFRWQTGAVTVLAFFTTLAASWASWRWFEKPLLKLGRRFSYE